MAFPVPAGWGVIDSTTPLSMDHDQAIMYRLMHWALVRECFCKDLHSKILKMVGGAAVHNTKPYCMAVYL